MLKTIIALAAAGMFAAAALPGTAQAAPIALTKPEIAKTASDIVQVRRGGGHGGMRIAGFRHGHRWHKGRHWRHKPYFHTFHVAGYATGCGYYFRKWKATGFRFWQVKYYNCISY